MTCRMKLILVISTCIISLFSFANAGELIYSTFLGSDDGCCAIAVDNAGNAYITGGTSSADFPTTSGAYDTCFHPYLGAGDQSNCFVTKMNADGSALIYSTFLSGDDGGCGTDITIDNFGNAYVTGVTYGNFPTTSGAFDTTFNTGNNTTAWDIFVAQLNATGSALIYSTYLGGTSAEYYPHIAIDNVGNAYITGWTLSPNFPTTPGALNTTYQGNADYPYYSFISKLNVTGSALVYSTFLGGNHDNNGAEGGIAVDSAGNAYITGWTCSSTFPTTPGAFCTTYNGGDDDIFVSKLNATGSALIYSTLLGGCDNDESRGITIDSAGNVYITGWTSSSNFPTTPNAFDSTFNIGLDNSSDAFVSKIDATGSTLIYSTFLGGCRRECSHSIKVDNGGNAYITGWTSSPDFPTTPDEFGTIFHGNDFVADTFVSELNADGSGLLYSALLGGYNLDYSQSIALDTYGFIYITGVTYSSDFPTTPGAFDTNTSFTYIFKKAFICKISLDRKYDSYGAFTTKSDLDHWCWQNYGNGVTAGTLAWLSTEQAAVVAQIQTQKGKLSQVFSVPSSGWYTAVAKVKTDIADISKQQKVYLYLQELDSNMAVVATASQVIQAGSGGFGDAGVWKQMQISFYTHETILAVQVVGINNSGVGIIAHLWMDDIWVYASAPKATFQLPLNNPSFSSGTGYWEYQVYADGTGPGIWSLCSSWYGYRRVLEGLQAGGEKGKVSQLYSASIKTTLASVWVYSSASTINSTQKVYLYVYSFDSGYTKIMESGNAVLQPGKWIPGEWRQLQFGYIPLTNYNAVQIVAINPTGNPSQSIYFDNIELLVDMDYY
jgi:hypothetical protein